MQKIYLKIGVKPTFRSWYVSDVHKTTDKAKEGKFIPVTGLEGPQGSETSRLSYFLDNRLTYVCEVVSLTGRQTALYPPGRFLVLISVRG
jgi:hypothetical protein